MRMKHLILMFCTFFISSCLAQVPKIESKRIVFSNGKYITLNENSETHILPNWQKVLIISKIKLYEGERKKLVVYSFDGAKIIAEIDFEGDEIIFQSKERILLAQKSAHRIIAKSYLLSSDGIIIKEISQSQNIILISKSEDEHVFWILSASIVNGNAIVNGSIYDSDGNLIEKFVSKGDETKIARYREKKYSIDIPKADLPG